MKIVRVTYTTTEQYAATNQANIKLVMEQLQQLKALGINYNVCRAPDSKTFIHTAFFNTEDDQKILFDLPEFKTFQEQLKASGPEAPPKQELLSLVGSSNQIFN